jgi:hypothetical protein
VTPACAFNDTTSLPLLLLESLKGTGTLKTISGDDEDMEDTMERAQSYFLVCAVMNKIILYAVGLRMLQEPSNESETEDEENHDETEGSVADGNQPQNNQRPSEDEINEEMSLLPNNLQTVRHNAGGRITRAAQAVYSVLPDRFKQRLHAIDSPFVDIILLCTLTGAVLGLVPKLHHLFFDPCEEGGVFNAWLTSSVKRIGKLFTTLQVFLVGCKLGVGFERLKRSRGSGKVPIPAILVIFIVRFLIWPM